MTEEELMNALRSFSATTVQWWWVCPKCDLQGDIETRQSTALEDLRYHINEDHKGED